MLFSSNSSTAFVRRAGVDSNKRDIAGKLFTVASVSVCFCFSSVVGSKLFQSTKHCKIKINLSAIEFNKAADLIAEREKKLRHMPLGCQKLGRSFDVSISQHTQKTRVLCNYVRIVVHF
jgi:hypothetical protein